MLTQTKAAQFVPAEVSTHDYEQIYTFNHVFCSENVTVNLNQWVQTYERVNTTLSPPCTQAVMGADTEPALQGTKEEWCGRVGERTWETVSDRKRKRERQRDSPLVVFVKTSLNVGVEI